MITARSITVEFDIDGFHRWPQASGDRDYLADRHRHRFRFAVRIPVTHDDRDVEFHDLLDAVRAHVADDEPVEFSSQSCEAIAAELAEWVADTFGPDWVEVAVSEDGYVTGSVRWEHP